jgi:phosphatidylglycerol:prolipoprotein diacylglycerol transferase
MYPRISDLFRDLFGIQLPFPIYSFGAMVAVAILLGTWLAAREMDRKYEAGDLGGVRVSADSGAGTTEESPSVLAGTLAVIAAVAGVVGAKLFTILGNPGRFLLNPAQMLFSMGGLTFYGGLLVAAGAIIWYLRRHDLSVRPIADAAAPGLMLAYGIGRIGCHLAGDGDWGIPADLAAKPDWVPTWLWAETYPQAIVGPPEQPVYPTSVYEAIAATLLFGVLWALRKHPYQAGWLFSLYLVFNGVERFLIEKIRVNPEYHLFGVTPTQAEIISVLLVIGGIAGLVVTWERGQ